MIDLSKAKPRAVEGYLREQVRKTWGDDVENAATITASYGYYNVSFYVGEQFYSFRNFRKVDAGRIAKAIRALRAV